MGKYIDKDDLAAKIEKLIELLTNEKNKEGVSQLFLGGRIAELQEVRLFLDTLETKELEEKFECPKVKIQDAIEVSSRMKYIDDDLKPIAEFIMNYASWNLHKDEWNQPVLEVPLFRVLDALAQKGKPYCYR